MTPAARVSGLSAFRALTFAYFATIGLFNPYAPLWFQQLGFSTVLIGGIASLQSWTRIVAPYGWSWLGDHGGKRAELIRIATIGCVATAATLLWARAPVAVAVATTLLFAANSGVVPLYEAVLAKRLSRDGVLDAARYGRVRVWGSVGFIASVTLSGLVLDAVGIATFPIAVAAMNLLLLAAALRLPATPADAVHDEPAPKVLHLLRRPEVAWFFASVFFTVLAHTSVYAFFSLYLVGLGYDKTAVGALWALSVAGEIVFFAFQGRWFARLSAHGWLLLVAATSVLRFVATAAGGQLVAALALAQLSHAITFAAHHAACITLVHRYFPDRLRGRGQALYTTLGYGVSGVLGGLGGGWLIEHAGFAAAFWAASVAALAGLGCAWRARALHRGHSAAAV
jgi:PPP family 3-phenylpropionic acid transporter